MPVKKIKIKIKSIPTATKYVGMEPTYFVAVVMLFISGSISENTHQSHDNVCVSVSVPESTGVVCKVFMVQRCLLPSSVMRNLPCAHTLTTYLHRSTEIYRYSMIPAGVVKRNLRVKLLIYRSIKCTFQPSPLIMSFG